MATPTEPPAAHRDEVSESVAVFAAAWTLLANGLPGGVVERLDGVLATFGHVPLPFFNVCLLDRPSTSEADLRRRLQSSVRYGRSGKHPWFAALCEDQVPAGWRRVAAAEGLHPAMPILGMVADELLPPRRPLPDLAFRRVADEASRQAVGAINCHAYGLPDEMAAPMATPSLWRDDWHGYLGERDGEALTCAAAFPAGGVLYVAMVATEPGHERRGLAEAVMRHALEQGWRAGGPRRTVLHATEAGRPLYAAMGYREVARFVLLAPEG